MTNAGMIEKALCDFFRSDSEFQIVEESSSIFKIAQPALSWYISSGTFEKDSKGVLTEKLNVSCLAVAKNVASEKERRAEAHEISKKVITKLSGISLALPTGRTGIFESVSWADVSGQMELEEKFMAVQIEFSVSMPAQSEHDTIEESGESLKESIRVAAKKLLESPSFKYRTLPTLGEWKFQSEKETIAKVFWSNESEVADERMNSFLRRKDVLNILVATPNTPDNFQDKTALVEESFNYAKFNQGEIATLMPEHRAQSLGLVKIAEVSVEYPALPEAYAITKITIIAHYALSQRG
jgi:hypothetical protein